MIKNPCSLSSVALLMAFNAVHEVLAYDKAFAAALEFLENDSTPGVLVSTSDHEFSRNSSAAAKALSYASTS
jgi:alkaline phosphatase